MKKYVWIALIAAGLLALTCNNADDGNGGSTPVDPDPGDNGYTTVSAAGVTFSYKIVGDSLECVLSAATTGWVSVGFDPSSRMKDANFIIGYVSGGTATVRDDWGTASTSHAADTGLGGSSDVTVISGTETGGTTEITFRIPLNSGDQYDKPLSAGNTYRVILARGSSDSYGTGHSARGGVNVTF